MSHSYAYARPALAADVVLFGAAEDELEVLLIERGGAPFLGCPALPGGFVRVDEDLEAAVRNRVLSLREAWQLFDNHLLTPEDSEVLELTEDLKKVVVLCFSLHARAQVASSGNASPVAAANSPREGHTAFGDA
jgi:hypothetical protein